MSQAFGTVTGGPIEANHGAPLADDGPTWRGQCGTAQKKPRSPGAVASGDGGGFSDDLIDPLLIDSQCCEFVVSDDQVTPVVALQIGGQISEVAVDVSIDGADPIPVRERLQKPDCHQGLCGVIHLSRCDGCGGLPPMHIM